MIVKWNCWGEDHELTVELDTYAATGNPAIVLKEKGEHFAVASVNIPAVYGSKNLVAIKNYSENEGVLEALQKAGVVGMVLDYAKSGWVQVPICKLLVQKETM